MALSPYLRRDGLALIAIGLAGFTTDYALNLGLSRVLTVHEYGDFKIARTFAMLFGAAVLLGGDRAAPKALAAPLAGGELGRAWEYLRFYLMVGLLLSAVVIALTWLGSLLHVGHTDPHDHHALAWLVVTVPVLGVGALASRTLQSAKRPVAAALPWRVGLPAIILAAVLVLASSKPRIDLEEVLLAAIGAAVVIAGWQWWETRRSTLSGATREPASADPRGWLAASLPMMGFFLVILALSQSDLYFLELLGDEREVGLYAAAETTAQFLLLIQTTMVGLMAPLAAIALEAGGEAGTKTYRQGQRLMLAGLVPAVLLLALAGEPLLGLFGSEYRQAVPELRWLLLANFAWAAAALSALWLQYTGRGSVVVMVAAVSLVIDSALNLLLIPRYGMLAAALSTAVTLSLAGATLTISRRRLTPG